MKYSAVHKEKILNKTYIIQDDIYGLYILKRFNVHLVPYWTCDRKYFNKKDWEEVSYYKSDSVFIVMFKDYIYVHEEDTHVAPKDALHFINNAIEVMKIANKDKKRNTMKCITGDYVSCFIVTLKTIESISCNNEKEYDTTDIGVNIKNNQVVLGCKNLQIKELKEIRDFIKWHYNLK